MYPLLMRLHQLIPFKYSLPLLYNKTSTVVQYLGVHQNTVLQMLHVPSLRHIVGQAPFLPKCLLEKPYHLHSQRERYSLRP